MEYLEKCLWGCFNKPKYDSSIADMACHIFLPSLVILAILGVAVNLTITAKILLNKSPSSVFDVGNNFLVYFLKSELITPRNDKIP